MKLSKELGVSLGAGLLILGIILGGFLGSRPQAAEIQKLERQVKVAQEYADEQTRRLSDANTRMVRNDAEYEKYLQGKWDEAKADVENREPGLAKLCVTETDDKTVMVVKECK